MSQAEELLKGLADDGATARTVDPSTEPHIVVNTDRTITVPEELKHIAVQFDHNIETVTFDCPRYWDEHDFSEMKVYVIYRRKDGYKDRYPADNLRVDETDADIIHFEWTISKNVTLVKGDISFIVCINYTDENGTERNHWNSRLNQDLIVDEGLECSTDEVVEQNPDVIESILVRLDAVERNGGGSGSGGNLENGEDGFSPIATVTQTDSGAVISITDKKGTTTATITNGKDGKDGADGAPGADGAKGDKGDKGDTGAQGEPGKDGAKGDKGDTGAQGIQGIQGEPGAKGEPGQRGTGLLPITTTPSTYTTVVNGLTPAYRIALSKVKSEASVSEVYAGDTLRHSYYHYPVFYVDSSYVYCRTRVSIRGANGADGKSAYQYAQDGGYTGTEEEFAERLASDGGGATPDFEAAEGEPGHILNRTHWRDVTETVLFERTVTISGFQFIDASGATIPLNIGETYTVVWDGVPYEQVAMSLDYNGYDAIGLGNAGIVPTTGVENTGEPFLIASIEGMGYGVVCLTDGEHTFTISGNEYTYHTIPPEYLAGSKPFYIDLKSDEHHNIVYETDITVNDVKNALNSGYQIVVRRTEPKWNWLDLFLMDRRVNSGRLYFYRITGRDVINDIEFLQFTPNGAGGYDITHQSVALIQKSDFPTALKNPYALTINGTVYDGSKTVNMTIQGGNVDTIPDYVRTEAERVAKVVQSRQNADTLTFLAASDFHYSTKVSNAAQQKESLTHMGQAMELIRKMVHVDFTVALGDMVWDSGETVDEAMAAMRFVSECLQNGQADLRTRGNHDCLYSNATGLTDAQIFANVGAWNSGAQHDPDNRLGGYCYRDFDHVKVRVICLNSAETHTGDCLFSTKQVTWLTNALNLSEKGAGWRSIIVSHHPLDWGKDGGGDPITAINGATGVIGAFHGHTHNFKVDTITGTNIKRIAIPNACVGRENEYTTAYGINWGEDTKYTKTAGTAADTSFCVVTIDLAEKKICADHYGAGYSREVEYIDTGDSGGSNYINAVDTAEADNSTDLYNGTGYKVGVYCSSNGGDSEDTACIATGNIPYNWAKDNPIYIKGANVTDASHVRIYGYSTKGDAPISSASCSGPTLSTYFTKEELETGNYFKLTPLGDLPQVEYLRLSLINTGGNLIVSFGKPIE